EFGVGLTVLDDDLGVELEGRVRAQPRGAGPDFETRIGPVERFALFAGEQLGQRLGGGFDRIGGGIEAVAALLRGLPGPFRLGPPSGGDCRIYLCRAALTGASDDLACSRIADLAPVGVLDRRQDG